MADSVAKTNAGGDAAKDAPQDAAKDAAKDAAPAANGTATPEATPPPASTAPPSTAPPSAAFKEQFKAFSKFGDTKSDGKHITLSQSDKWMKQAKVVDGKSITTTDTGIHFKKFKLLKITQSDYIKFIEDLAKARKVDVEEIKKKMSDCGAPGVTSAVGKSKADAAVERLTDVTKYTGSHKQRFDQSGKGRGIAGRKDVQDGSGYVQGYKDKDTYSKTH